MSDTSRCERCDKPLGIPDLDGLCPTCLLRQALVGASQGVDAPKPDEAVRAKLRAQALGWLTSELAAWAKLLTSGPPQQRPSILKTLQHWKEDADLVSVRDPDALAKLPTPERKKWTVAARSARNHEVQALRPRAREMADPPS